MSECQDCARKDQAIAELVRALAETQQPRTPKTPATDWGRSGTMWDRSKCPCNPALGGSGVCGCIMGSPTISCSTRVSSHTGGNK